MKIGASVEPSRFEPTVFGAVRQHRTMVLAVAVMSTLAAIAYTLIEPRVYRAQGNVTVPEPQGQQVDSAQYLDSQVLLLQSEDVAREAAGIANGTLHSNSLTTDRPSSPRPRAMATRSATSSSGY